MREANPALVVLAAGIGSRYGGLKQLDPVGPGGEIIMEYAIYDALRAGFDRAVFVIRKDFEAAFRDEILARFEDRIACTCVHQELSDLPAGYSLPEGRTKPWGTAHALRSCRDAVDTACAVINADDFYGAESYRIVADELRRGGGEADWAMVGFLLEKTLSEHGSVCRGICRTTPSGQLESVEEHVDIERQADGTIRGKGALSGARELSPEAIASLNFWGFTPLIFGELERLFAEFLIVHGQEQKAEFFLPSVVDRLIKEGLVRVNVAPTPERWFGVTYPDDKPVVAAKIRELVDCGVYPERLWS